MKLILVLEKEEDIEKYNNIDNFSFIIGLENYSVNYPEFNLSKIKELSNKYSIFVSINKNIFNSEIEDLKDKLIELSKLPIKGILFYDLGILNIVKENNINIDLVWHQTHMVTNYNTCNFYYDKGVKYAYVANEITLDEIIEIKKNTNIKLMVEIFGYPIMSHSRRYLLTNYFKSINKDKENRTYTLKENDNNYLLKETNNGASILYGKLINGTKPLFTLIENDIDYCVLDMQEVDNNIGISVIKEYIYILNNYNNIDELEKENIINKMNNLIGDSTNFFYKKTIYKVKKG